MSTKKHIGEIRDLLVGLGITGSMIEQGRKHMKVHVSGPNGTRKVTTSTSPSDHRTLLNLRSTLRHAAREVGALA